MLPYVLITHEVADYSAWKAIFNSAADMRKAAGEISYQVLRYESKANCIVHFSAWSSLAAARAFFESDALVAIREKAGVKAPQFVYLEEIETGTL